MPTPTLHGSPVVGSFTSGTSNPSAVMPAAVDPGDLLIVRFVVDENNAPTWPTGTLPAGWVAVGSIGFNANARTRIFYKIAAGTEDGATVVFPSGANVFGSYESSAWANVDNTTPFDVASSAFAAGTLTATPAQTSQTTVTANAVVIGYFGRRGDPSLLGAAGSGATELVDNDDASNIYMYSEYLVKTVAGAIALTMTLSPAAHDNWHGMQLALRPSAGGGGGTTIGPFTIFRRRLFDAVIEGLDPVNTVLQRRRRYLRRNRIT